MAPGGRVHVPLPVYGPSSYHFPCLDTLFMSRTAKIFAKFCGPIPPRIPHAFPHASPLASRVIAGKYGTRWGRNGMNRPLVSLSGLARLRVAPSYPPPVGFVHTLHLPPFGARSTWNIVTLIKLYVHFPTKGARVSACNVHPTQLLVKGADLATLGKGFLGRAFSFLFCG